MQSTTTEQQVNAAAAGISLRQCLENASVHKGGAATFRAAHSDDVITGIKLGFKENVKHAALLRQILCLSSEEELICNIIILLKGHMGIVLINKTCIDLIHMVVMVYYYCCC